MRPILPAILLGASLCAVASGQRLSEEKPPPEGAADAAPALGIALEGWPYPFPVRFLPLAVDGQDVRMAYMDVPPSAAPNGRCALMLHGKNFSGAYWASTARAALAGAGFRVVIPDQIEFGKSTMAEIRYSFDRLAENTAKLLESLSVSRCVVAGHSMGGMLAVRFARNFPERTERLVLECDRPRGLSFSDSAAASGKAVCARARQHRRREDPRIFRRYFVVWKPEYERFVQIRSRVGGSGDYPRYAMASALTYEMIYQQPVRHEFPPLAVPTLLVIGQADRTTIGRGSVPEAALQGIGDYPALGKAAARDIRGSRLVEIPGVGHIPHLEAPHRFHAALLDFLAARP